ncbi:unnamed protein product [Effrenium voratum]|nr:unnamed protein product [Effrenium voratum]
MDDKRWLLLALALCAALVSLREGAKAKAAKAATATAKAAAAVLAKEPEAVVVQVLSFLLPALGLEACALRGLCAAALAQLTPRAVQFAAEDAPWLAAQMGELCLAKIAAVGGAAGCAEHAVRRAVAVAKLADRRELWAADAMGRSALVAAACCSRRNGWGCELLRALLEQRADLEARSPDGWNALMWAAQLGNPEECRLLLEARASPNAVSVDGTSPLLCAVRADKTPLQVVQLLLASRADPALVPMQSPFDEYVDMDVREALARAPHQR